MNQITFLSEARPHIATIMNGLDPAADARATHELSALEEQAVTTTPTTGDEALAQVLQIARIAGTLESSAIDGKLAQRLAKELLQIASAQTTYIQQTTGTRLDPECHEYYFGQRT